MVVPFRLSALALPILLMPILPVAAAGKPVLLPANAPIPEAREPASPHARTPAKPERRQAEQSATPAEHPGDLLGTVPLPTPKPADTAEQQQPADDQKQPERQPELPDPRSTEIALDPMPANELACRERLKALGVEFADHKAERDTDLGCSVPYPLTVKSLGANIGLSPEAILNCAMAEAAARFAAGIIQPSAKADLGTDLKSISQASTYVCRPRHGSGKLSEHAFGNALDIASFTLSDGSHRSRSDRRRPRKTQTFLDDRAQGRLRSVQDRAWPRQRRRPCAASPSRSRSRAAMAEPSASESRRMPHFRRSRERRR